MNGESNDRRERARHLMMAALDGELSREERRELDGHLQEDAVLQAEWEQMHKVKEITDTMGYRELPEEVWDGYWERTFNQLERGVGWVLVSLGAVVLAGYGAWQWLQAVLAESGLPLYFKVALFAVVLGGLILTISVIREKWFTHNRDPYKGVKR